METLLITPAEITDTTILGGNIDLDKYRFCIFDTQLRVIEPLLGTELYEKVLTDYENNDLSGLYLELYSDYLKPILKFSSVANYLEIASYMVDNGGIFKYAPESKEIPSISEITGLTQKYNSLADMFIIRFDKWICNNTITEYNRYQDKVNAKSNLRTKIGWKL
jgi:hypothetical protein